MFCNLSLVFYILGVWDCNLASKGRIYLNENAILFIFILWIATWDYSVPYWILKCQICVLNYSEKLYLLKTHGIIKALIEMEFVAFRDESGLSDWIKTVCFA